MTTVFEHARDRGQLHALVIGVDRYPYCGPGTAHRNEWRPLARRIKSLESPSPSALSVAGWLLARQHDEGQPHPVGSLELVVSAQPPPTVDGRSGATAIEPATFDGIRAAFDRWYDRCHERPDNLAFFYFCGHGLRIGGDDLLLPEDFGASGHRFFENAIDFRETYWAMRQCRARTQCYFVDACRDVPDQLLGKKKTGARPLKESAETPTRHAPIVYSTLPGQRAWGAGRQPTLFTRATLEALDGRAAECIAQQWEIRTDNLARMIGRVIQWNDPTTIDDQVVDSSGQAGDGLVRRLATPPDVPVRMGCAPAAALPAAHLRLVGNEHAFERLPAEGVWSRMAPAGTYKYSAEFTVGGYVSVPNDVLVLPPHQAYDLPVEAT